MLVIFSRAVVSRDKFLLSSKLKKLGGAKSSKIKLCVAAFHGCINFTSQTLGFDRGLAKLAKNTYHACTIIVIVIWRQRSVPVDAGM